MSDETKNNNPSLSVNEGVEQNNAINRKGLERFKNKGSSLSLDEYVDGIKSGNRTILSRAITLIESTKTEHRELAQDIIEQCLPDTGNSIRLGITGVPGVGKSTFIESLGNHIIDQGNKLAVLAIDPSSTRTKGSILGDKTRMETLATNDNAFIRPSPTGGSLGGVARKTRETIYLCEAAGFDTIFIETVGVGQSETTVHSMVDFFLLLMLAGAGDELQGIKRGIMEMADAIAINKVDEASEKAVNQAVREYKNALHLYPETKSGWSPKVTTCSALTDQGISEIWEMVQEYMQQTKENGYFEDNRNRQAKHWMYDTISNRLTEHFYDNPAVKKKQQQIEQQVLNGEISSFKAAQKLLDLYFRKMEN
ncbi:methylmalonyl Co-A mutase-associated GTPase MeaB [Aliifodinibius salipaludis]|uniref:Methylmalonyl Co-A mutase-associated GTPase MeaB n=1 Tax=Fodinibius salipaludis TaxID=2032627 RepID=A0A2A2GBP5_9BACT|nr:methylmalonyl Co-A mutase-associated GTPase MeaB [Aliifodinibius salipaludis]PAU95126.1 methylmalonyl Co-A mutase-associated GTPase MeaB [Aliifodinibius salipaludis]